MLSTNSAEEDDEFDFAAYSPPGPYFDKEFSRNVTALVGKTASLSCKVLNAGNRTISFVRHRDIHLLTVGRDTYTSDQRFQALHKPHTNEWTLQIRYPQIRDSGTYECQVSTSPPIGHFVHLIVVQPNTSIMGSPEMYINRGSTINLTCVVEHSPEPPANILWTHNNQEINYDSPRGGVSVITEKGDVTVSYLLIQKARPSDTGRYSCAPTSANAQEIQVHVLNDLRGPAAMQHGGQLKLEYPLSAFLLSISVLVLGT
ncbi:zwei Ig domain protein zig-8 isoform X2 [Folsomia candida]|uniref:zwei Ig domain protein zig-8 isoform X2 n=1 Tax=Folsomia candida TaxID=158441 RepID=UPI001604DB1A|nr:zwei Ig domain protein zig-8 isoform X2 [Folsomia candida]